MITNEPNIFGFNYLKNFDKGDCVSFTELGGEKSYGIIVDIYTKEIGINRQCVIAQIRTMRGITIKTPLAVIKLEAKVKRHEKKGRKMGKD